MGFAYLIAGMVFLFNPNVNIVDVLPDAIGYILIIYGLKKLADFYPMLAESRKIFKTLLFVETVKIVVMFITYLFITDKGFLLVFTFVFSFFEILYMTGAFSRFFDSMLYLGTRHDGTAVFKKASEIKTLTMVFIIARAVLPVLPELTFLSSTAEDDGYVNNYVEPVDYSEFKGIFTAAAVLLLIIIGIIWLVMIVKYLSAIRKDSIFIRNLQAYYNEVILPDTDMFIRRRLTFAYSLFLISMLLVFNLYSDGINFIPNFLCGAIFIIGCCALYKYSKLIIFGVIPAVGLIGTDLASWLIINSLKRYYTYNKRLSGDALIRYNAACVLSIAAAICLAAMIAILFIASWKMINEHTPIRSVSDADSVTKEKNRRIKFILRFRAIIFMLLSLAVAASGSVQIFCLYSVDSYMLIHLLITIVWFISAFSFISRLKEQILVRYFG